jgi:hypothetical protein
MASSHAFAARAMRSARPRAGQFLRTNAASFELLGEAQALFRRRGLLVAAETERFAGARLMTGILSLKQNLLHASAVLQVLKFLVFGDPL